MTALKITLRSIRLCFAILTGCLLTLLFQRGNMTTHSLSGKMTRWWNQRIANALGIPVRIFGSPCNDATLIIANHISWFDIIALGSVVPVRFLAKVEVKHIPVIGWLATRAGTLYIERGGKTATKKAITIMADTLSDQTVILFAEGTTRDGTSIRFHSRLTQSAIDADCMVQPVAVIYPSANNNTMHPAALFVGDTTMGQSYKMIASSSELIAELHFLEPLAATGKTRNELTRYCEDKVREMITKRLA